MGAHDGDEVEVDGPGNRVHVAELLTINDWLRPVNERALTCYEFVMPMRLTRDGYRCYWSERRR